MALRGDGGVVAVVFGVGGCMIRDWILRVGSVMEVTHV